LKKKNQKLYSGNKLTRDDVQNLCKAIENHSALQMLNLQGKFQIK